MQEREMRFSIAAVIEFYRTDLRTDIDKSGFRKRRERSKARGLFYFELS